MTPLEKNIMKPKRRSQDQRSADPFEERVIEVSRVSRTVKGGRRIRFRALVVVGDRKGRVGMGLGKANEVTGAVQKASSRARKALVNVPVIEGTIPHEIIGQHGAARVLLRPASSGTSIVAGGSVRVVAELAGISDLLGKSLGSRSKVNNVAATIDALTGFSERVVSSIKLISEKKLNRTEASKESTESDEKPALEVKVNTAEQEEKKTEKKKNANTKQQAEK